MEGGAEGGGGGFALGDGSDGEDYFGGIQAKEVAGGLEA